MSNPLFLRTWPALAAAAVLAGCSLIPTYERPVAPVAKQWSDAKTAGAAATAALAADLDWQDFIGDTNLRSVIRLALDNNRDLRVAVLNIEQARAQYQIRRADQLPTISAGVTGSRQSTSELTKSVTSSFSAGLNIPASAAWELDFFGRLGSLKEAALAQYLATEEARKAAQISLIASVASTWLSLQANTELLDLAQRTLATREDSLRLTRLRFDNGATSALDLRQAESLTAAARASAAQQQRLRAQDINALTLLAGQTVPEPLLRATHAAPSASLFKDLPVGLPSEVLTRRPDIRQAEQQLIAANASIGAARAAFFPRISLTAFAGSASSDLDNLFKSGTWGWTLAPSALVPIFDAGRNRANLESSKAGREIAVAQYEKAIQTAFREVADTLAGRATLGEQLQAQQAQASAESERAQLAELRYRNGVASSLDLLDAQRSLFAVQQLVAQTRLAQQQNQVSLYKALGGGWTPPVQQVEEKQAGL
ncbi:MAG: efflux transporter outer membrane subunit [Hylemonella sp.]|nr:efflux transporter outer membrane subunit [Hylemonella sp.]MDP1937754.1 efflux transporter outer membrane subunit [Hylemonella sp.]